jgi:hypothetical protein
MAKYRKKPVVIEAVRVTAADYNPAIEHPWDGCPFSEIPYWLEAAVEDNLIVPHNRGSTDYASWDIKTLEGTMTAGPGDWIIRGVKGEFYPCKPDIFAATYDLVTE